MCYYSYNAYGCCNYFFEEEAAMTFMSPTFVFIFLPIFLSLFYIAPKNRRIDMLPIASAVFFVCLNISDIYSLGYYFAMVLGVIFAVRLYKKTKNKLCLISLCILASAASVMIIFNRLANSFEIYHHAGLVICLFSVISLCIDIMSENGRAPDSIWEALIYVTFFPISVVGPFVRYGDFIEKLDKIEYTIEKFFKGLVRFLAGFVLCAGVSAVLRAEYNEISKLSGQFGMLVYVFSAMICGIEIYTFFMGYSNMARGISLMLGIDLDRDFGNPMANASPVDYVRRFFTGLAVFCRTYIAFPIDNAFGKTMFGRLIACIISGGFYVFLICRSAESALALLLPACIVSYFVMFRPKSKRIKIGNALKVPFGILTVFIMSLVWNLVSIGSVDVFVAGFKEAASFKLDQATYEVLGVILSWQNFIIPAISAFAAEFAIRALKADSLEGDSGELRVGQMVWRSVAIVLLVAVFVMCVFMILPRFPSLVYYGFKYSFI